MNDDNSERRGRRNYTCRICGPLTTNEPCAHRRARASAAAHESWARTENRSARTRAARDAADARFENLVDPTGELPPQVRAAMAESKRRAFYRELALRSAEVRRRRRWQAGEGGGPEGPEAEA